jgi:hypothetical protein
MSQFRKSVLSLFLVVLLMFSLASLVSATFHPTPCPPPLSEEDKILENNALQFLSTVANVNVSRYHIEHLWVRNEAPVPLPYSGKTFSFNLSSSTGILDVQTSFVDGRLYLFSVYTVRGYAVLNHPASLDVLATAKDTLAQLQAFSPNDYLPTFQSMLGSVADLTVSEISNANWTQKIANNGNIVTMTWEPFANGLSQPQNNLHLEFQNGNLHFFSNFLGLYEIGGSDVKISEEQAIQIAVEHARNFSYVQKNVTVSNFDILQNIATAKISLGVRGNNTLYPYWNIMVPLAKEYPGGVTYFRVIMWADTGEITTFSPMGSYGVSNDDGSNAIPSSEPQQTTSPTANPPSAIRNALMTSGLMIGLAMVAVVIIVAGYLFFKRKK